MQRAFQSAGARSVVATLWEVNDDAARALMERLYRNLWDKKMSKLEALRSAQIELLRQGWGPEAPTAPLSPYYWARLC